MATVYRKPDLLTPDFQRAIIDATALWRDLCKKHYLENGDYGSCVVGAGIEVQYLAPRCRNPRQYMIIRAHDVAACQGSLNWEASYKTILQFLAGKGIDASFNWGRMD